MNRVFVSGHRGLLVPALLAIVALASQCRHAHVRFDPPLPAVCSKSPTSPDCERAKKTQDSARQSSTKGTMHVVHQDFLLFGLYPRRQIIDLSKYCPSGAKSLHQYVSLEDGLLEQLTLTIYSPRTLEIECYQ